MALRYLEAPLAGFTEGFREMEGIAESCKLKKGNKRVKKTVRRICPTVFFMCKI